MQLRLEGTVFLSLLTVTAPGRHPQTACGFRISQVIHVTGGLKVELRGSTSFNAAPVRLAELLENYHAPHQPITRERLWQNLGRR